MALHSAAQTEGREVVIAFRVPPRLSQHRDEYFFQAETRKQMLTGCTLYGSKVLFIPLMLFLQYECFLAISEEAHSPTQCLTVVKFPRT